MDNAARCPQPHRAASASLMDGTETIAGSRAGVKRGFRTPHLSGVELTAAGRVRTNIGVIHDPGHDESWIVAMSAKPGCLTTLDYARRWGIEPMFSDFKSRGFGLDDTQIRYPDRLARLVLVMALALYCAVSTGLWDQANHPLPAEVRPARKRPKKVARSLLLLHPRTAPHREPASGCLALTNPLGRIRMKLIDAQLGFAPFRQRSRRASSSG
jgi:hypothetical protein